jgi:hypothetical protein
MVLAVADAYLHWVKTILMPIDYAMPADNTLRQARKMLNDRGENWKVLLLGTFRGPFTPISQSVAIHDDLKRKTLEQLAIQRDLLRDSGAANGMTFELLAYMGSLENIVNYLSHEQKVDCLLLSTDLHANREEFGKVLSRVRCPILVIPAIGKEV